MLTMNWTGGLVAFVLTLIVLLGTAWVQRAWQRRRLYLLLREGWRKSIADGRIRKYQRRAAEDERQSRINELIEARRRQAAYWDNLYRQARARRTGKHVLDDEVGVCFVNSNIAG